MPKATLPMAFIHPPFFLQLSQPASAGRQNAELFAVVGHRAAGDRNPSGREQCADAVVAQRLERVLAVDDLTYPSAH